MMEKQIKLDSIYFYEKGNGIPLILLHGNGEDHNYFINQINYFSKNYRVIAVDTRGHGRSPRGETPFNLDQFVEDLHQLMEKEKIDKSIILGFSDGGNIALKFALKYQKKVVALVLNGANLNPKGVKRTTQIPIEIGYKIAKRFAKKSDKAKLNAEMLSLMVLEPNIKLEQLKNINIPTLVIVGTRDMIKRKHSEAIALTIPNAKLAIIKGNHFIANKKSDSFNHEVTVFLKDSDPKK